MAEIANPRTSAHQTSHAIKKAFERPSPSLPRTSLTTRLIVAIPPGGICVVSERRQTSRSRCLPASPADTIATIEGGTESSLRFARRRWSWAMCLVGLVGALAIPAAASADRYVYVSNGFPAGSNDVSALHINPDGSLTPVLGSPFPTGGTVTEGLSMTPDAQHLY